MFLRNNPRIDFAGLEERVALERERIQQAPKKIAPQVAPAPPPGRLPTDMTEPAEAPTIESPVAAAPVVPPVVVPTEPVAPEAPAPRPTLLTRIKLLVWGVLHVRLLFGRLVKTFFWAEHAHAQVGRHTVRLDILGDRLEERRAGQVELFDRFHRLADRVTVLHDEGRSRADRQEAWTAALVADIRGSGARLTEAETSLRTVAGSALEMRTDLTALKSAVAGLTAARGTQATALDQHGTRIAALEQEVARLGAALTAANGQLADQMRQQASRIAAMRGEIMFQQRRLTRLATPAETGATAPLPAAAAIADQRLDSLYAAFEDVFRGERDDIKNRLRTYLEKFQLSGAGQFDKPILDIGCGRGEWIELLGDNHLAAYGIDINSIMVERSRALGLDATQADLLSHLRSLADGSRSGITAFHVVEHLPFEVLVDFLDEALRVLMPGGILLLETPNPETMRVGASTFYNDPTHRNPLMPAPLRFMVEHRGFADVEVLKLHPFTEGLLTEPTADAGMLNELLFGPQDYAVVARRI